MFSNLIKCLFRIWVAACMCICVNIEWYTYICDFEILAQGATNNNEYFSSFIGLTNIMGNLFRLHSKDNYNLMKCLRWNWHLNWAWTSNHPLSKLFERIIIIILWTWCVFSVHCTHPLKYQLDIILIKPLSRHFRMEALFNCQFN